MITLGVDVGTTHTKVLALEVSSGGVLALETGPTPVARDADGEAHRPAEVLELVLTLASDVVGRLDDPGSVGALSVASVGEEVVLLDAEHDPVGDAICWYDPRGTAEAAAWLAGPGASLESTRRWPPDPTFSLFKLLWLRDHRPDDLRRAVTWTDLGDYILAALGAGVVMDWTHASRAAAFDLEQRRWDPASIEATGIEIEFPRLEPSGRQIGTISRAIAARIGLRADVALVSGGHDHLCAAFGTGLQSGRQLFLSAGTSEAHLALLDAPLEGDRARSIDQGCYVDAERYYAHVNIHSGHFFQQWRELLYRDGSDEALYAEVDAAVATDIEFEPLADQHSARFDRLPYEADRATVMRAVMSGLARRSAEIVETLESAAGQPFERLLVAGQPAHIETWKRLRADAYRWPMATVDTAEPTAYGAALLAARAIGS